MNKDVLRSILTFYGMPHPNIVDDASPEEKRNKFEDWLSVLCMYDADLNNLINSKLIQIKPSINEAVNYDLNILVDKDILNGKREYYNRIFIKFIFTLYKEQVYIIRNILPLGDPFDECKVVIKDYMADELANVIKFIKNIECETIRILLDAYKIRPILDLTMSILNSGKFNNIIYQVLNDDNAPELKKYIYANLGDTDISKVTITNNNGVAYSRIFY